MAGAGGLLKREFSAMGTEIAMFCADGPGAERRLEWAARWVAAYENRLSRFIPYSELSRLNNAGGQPFKASPLLFDFVRVCLDLARRSGGVFDPTLLHEIEAAGYDRTFDMIGRRPRVPLERGASFRDIRLDPAARTITLPESIGIDSGGLGKGWAADRVARYLGPNCLVDCGGDIATRGRPPEEDAWYVGIQEPFTRVQDFAVLALSGQGVATSSTLKRRWATDDGFAHHLIDARTRQPSTSDVAAVTALAPDATMADYQAKVALLKGSRQGLTYLEGEPETEGVMTLLDGSRCRTSGFDRYLVSP